MVYPRLAAADLAISVNESAIREAVSEAADNVQGYSQLYVRSQLGVIIRSDLSR